MVIPSTATVTKSNLFRQSHANIYNIINNRSNVVDPIDSSGDRKFVYNREPRNLGRNFRGYPIVIVYPVDISQSGGTVSATKSFIEWIVTITVMSSDKSSDSSGNPVGAQYLDTISDDILEALNSEARTEPELMNIDSSPADWAEIDGEMIFTREFTITFKALTTIA